MSLKEDFNGNAIDLPRTDAPSDTSQRSFQPRSPVTPGHFNPDMFFQYDDLTRLDLVTQLKTSEEKCRNLEKTNTKLEALVFKLEEELCVQTQKCKTLEADRSFLRNNIRKVSANWFDRKSKLSEGDHSDTPNDDRDTSEAFPQDETSDVHSSSEVRRLYAKLRSKSEKLELSEMRAFELSKRLKDFEQLIENQEIIIHGMKDQLNTYFNDNQKMSKQLSDINKLFRELELANDQKVTVDAIPTECSSPVNKLPTESDFEDMAGSVTKTYMKLKELIYEKRSLVTEIERLQTLNVELQHRVTAQENRLTSVTDALQTTWLLVSNLKDEHAKIHTQETILRYELKEKREILNNLKSELEMSREQWQSIKQMNTETEHEWRVLKDELSKRREDSESSTELLADQIEGAVGGSPLSKEVFEPPVDMLVDMAVEYGVIGADDEEPMTVVALLEGQDVHSERLQNLEDQCCHLYHKLMSSTQRALTLASHLTTLHEHYGDSYTDSEDESDEEFENDGSQVVSPDPESYDTAYVSEGDGAESSPEVSDVRTSTNDNEATEISSEVDMEAQILDSAYLNDESCDVLSRKLINFLPKKIEILKAEIKKLEEKLQLQTEEKAKAIATLTTAIEAERRQRRQAEDQLKHLGKCVDELKLERNGQIAAVEHELEKKIEEVRRDTELHEELKSQHEALRDKYEQRETILQATVDELKKTEHRAETAEQEVEDVQKELESTKEALKDVQKELESTKEVNKAKKQSVDQVYVREEKQYEERPPVVDQSSVRQKTELTASLSTNVFENLTQKVQLAPNSVLKVPILLGNGCIFSWCFKIGPEGLRFCITYEELRGYSTTNGNRTSCLPDICGCECKISPQKEEAKDKEVEGTFCAQKDAALGVNSEGIKEVAGADPNASYQNPVLGVRSDSIEEGVKDVEDSRKMTHITSKNYENKRRKEADEITVSKPDSIIDVDSDKKGECAVDLLSPIYIPHSTTTTRGTLRAKTSGLYTLVFHNINNRSQEVHFKIWQRKGQ